MYYSVETLNDCLHDLFPLIEEVWNEVDQRKGVMELDPDIEAYRRLEDSGMLRIYTLREDTSELVGFVIMLVQPVLHCKGHYHGITDVMYIQPQHRGKGLEFIQLIENDLKEEGVSWMAFTVKADLDSGKLAEAAGYRLFEKTYNKRL